MRTWNDGHSLAPYSQTATAAGKTSAATPGLDQGTARMRRLAITSLVEADERVLRLVREAAGQAGCADGTRPGQLVLFPSRVRAVRAALAEAGVEVVEVTP